jgi:hypothetical protein
MFYSNTTYLGIDPTAGDRPFTYVALDQERSLLAIGQGDMEEVLAFIAGQRSAIVAVCAPRSPNRGLMTRAEVRELSSLSSKGYRSPVPGNISTCLFFGFVRTITAPQT